MPSQRLALDSLNRQASRQQLDVKLSRGGRRRFGEGRTVRFPAVPRFADSAARPDLYRTKGVAALIEELKKY